MSLKACGKFKGIKQLPSYTWTGTNGDKKVYKNREIYLEDENGFDQTIITIGEDENVAFLDGMLGKIVEIPVVVKGQKLKLPQGN